MWANPDCTERPVVGQEYSELYAQINKDYGLNDGRDFGNGVFISTPSAEYPEDPYFVLLYGDWFSDEYGDPLRAGMVIECSNSSPYPIEPDWEFSFDPLT